MVIGIFYVSIIGYTVLFGWILNQNFDFSSPLFYILALLSLIIAIILGVVNVLLTTRILTFFRKNKGFDNKFNHYYAKGLLQLVNYIFRIKTHVSGYENVPKDNNFVLISNHQDNFDIMVYLPVFKDHPISFIAKEALFKAPIVGAWIGFLGNVPISRFADRAAAEAIINGIKRYKSGVPFGIFPEGKRSFGNEMIEFKAGAFKLAMKPKADILIGVLYDVHKASKKKFYQKLDVYVHFLPVLKYEEYKHMKSQELSEHVKSLIQAQLDVFNEAKK